MVFFTTVDILFVWVRMDLVYADFASLLRASRILRILKLLKLSQKMLNIVHMTYEIIKNMKNFAILLLIFTFFFCLLGMELFAYKCILTTDGLVPKEGDENLSFPPSTFNNFYWSFLSISIVWATDGWSNIYIDHYRIIGKTISSLYFFPMKIFGGYIILNLFLAILLSHYDKESESQEVIYQEEKVKRKESLGTYMKEKFFSITMLRKVKDFFLSCYHKNFRINADHQAIMQYKDSKIPDIKIQSTQDMRRRSRKSIGSSNLEN